MVETEDLIKKLCKDKKKVKCVSPKSILLKAIIVFSLIIVAVLLTISRSDLHDIVSMPIMLAELLFALATGLLSAVAASWLSTPDVKQQRWVVWLPFIPFTMLCILVLHNIIMTPMDLLANDDFGVHCITITYAFAFIPAIALIVLLKCNANTHSTLFSVMSVMSVATFGYFCSRLICYKDNLEHLLIWHYIPVVLLSVVAAMIGSKLLRWK